MAWFWVKKDSEDQGMILGKYSSVEEITPILGGEEYETQR